MKKSEILLIKSIKGEISVEDLSKVLGKSKSFVVKAYKELERKSLVDVKKKGKKIFLSLHKSPKTYLILSILEKYPRAILFKREILLKELYKWRSLKDLQVLTNLSLKTLISYLKEFESYGIVKRKKDLFKINEEKKEIFQYVQILNLEKDIFWRRGKEILKVSEEIEESFCLTSFSLFPKFGIRVLLPRYYLYSPKKELSREEILIHSLVFSETLQGKILASIFYLKERDRMDENELIRLAKKFEVLGKFFELKSFIKEKKSFLEEKLEEYRVKLTETTKDILTKLFGEIDKELKKKVSIFLFGGANMVLRGLKVSTKDIDLLVRKKDYQELKRCLLSLGFKFSHNIFERDIRMDVFVERVLSGYKLSKEMRGSSEIFWEGRKISVYLLKLEFVFLFKSYAGREVDVEDCRILAERGLDWNLMFKEIERQSKKIKRVIELTFLDICRELKERYGIKIPIERKVNKIVLEKLLIYTLKNPLSVKQLVEKTNIPEPTLRKYLEKLRKEGKIKRIKKGNIFCYLRI